MHVYNYASNLIDTPLKTVTQGIQNTPYIPQKPGLDLSAGSSKKPGVTMGTGTLRESKTKLLIKNPNKDQDLEELNHIQKTIENILITK